MVKKHLNLSIDDYVLTEFKKVWKGSLNLSVFLELKMHEYIDQQGQKVKQCMDCKTFYEAERVTGCPKCGSINSIEKRVRA